MKSKSWILFHKKPWIWLPVFYWRPAFLLQKCGNERMRTSDVVSLRQQYEKEEGWKHILMKC